MPIVNGCFPTPAGEKWNEGTISILSTRHKKLSASLRIHCDSMKNGKQKKCMGIYAPRSIRKGRTSSTKDEDSFLRRQLNSFVNDINKLSDSVLLRRNMVRV